MIDRIREAARPALIHLGVSALVAAMAYVLVFWVWFPSPFDRLLAGRDLFWLMLSVDLVCGPLLTAVVFSRAKPWKELVLDLSFIGLLQLAALVYGLWSVHLGRPVVVAFETDRFRVVSAADVWDADEGKRASLPLFSIRLKGVSDLSPSDSGYIDSFELSLKGIPTGVRHARWVPYDEVRDKVRKLAKPLAELHHKHAATGGDRVLTQALVDLGLTEADLGYWPVQSRLHSDWVALVSRKDGEIKRYLQLDPW